MSDKDDDIGFYLSMGALITLALWIVRKPSRILTVFLIVVICASWTAIHEASQRETKKAKYEQRQNDKKREEGRYAADTRFKWYQQARVIEAWENYLATMPDVVESKYWHEHIVNGYPFIEKDNGQYLARKLNHAEISKFINEVLPTLFGDKVYTEHNNPFGFGTTHLSNTKAVLEFLFIKKNNDGLYYWYGPSYGQKAYKWVNPTPFIPVADPERDLHEWRQWQDEIEAAYNSYNDAIQGVRINRYEEEDLKPLVSKTRKLILKNSPGLSSEELEKLLQAKVLDSYDYRMIHKAYPDYQLPESLTSI